ncbi:NFATC2-interacting protein [Brachyistius frenatus]|uniref:NFATC2-interacting protein n=1 Tax=Brachyistius frenatus TaxID=100188 RepID=UPI0037E93C39
MAEAVSDSEGTAVEQPPKRRRILDPSAVVGVPVYSSKVSSSLQMKPAAAVFLEKENADGGPDDGLWSDFTSRRMPPPVITFSDSEDEAEHVRDQPEQGEAVRCPSPPPPESPVQKQSRKVKDKLSEIDRRLQEMNSLLSPDIRDSRSRRLRSRRSSSPDDDDYDDIIVMSPNDDIIVVSPTLGSQSSPYSSSAREIPLKIRCRTDVHKIPVLPATPLRDVVAQLSVILNVPPPRLLLLREEVELPTGSTVGQLGLGIADIIECVVMAAEDKSEADDSSIITVRLQSRDRDASQEFSLHRDAPLGSVFSRYLSEMSAAARSKVRFHYDGSKVDGGQTPAQLDMEDGDIIEVWT